MKEKIRERARILRKMRRGAALIGAGTSSESGVPTFRGKDGLWNKYRPEDLATPEAFMKNPDLVWEWYKWRIDLVKKTQPNPGHYTLKEFENIFDEFYTITQNVDNLHQKAGSKNVIELHGNLLRAKCTKCGRIYKEFEFEKGKLPKCPECGGLLRPDVVWFGEMLPMDALRRSFEIARKSEFFFVVGTSAVVYPAARLPFEAKENGALIIEVNIERTPVTAIADFSFMAPAGEILPKILEEIKNG